MKVLKNTAVGLLALLLLLLAACGLSVTLTSEGLLPAFLPFKGYTVTDPSFGEVLPEGSLAIVDPEAKIEAGHVVLVFDGPLAVADGKGNLISNAEPSVIYDESHAAGRVIYRINGLGAALQMLQEGKIILWAILGLGTAVGLAWAITAPRRRRRKEVQELIELFDYYGRKFDAEEEGIDY